MVLGAAGLAGAGAALYNTAPFFWHRLVQDMQRDILPPFRHPDPAAWPSSGIYGAWLGHTTVLMKVDGFTLVTDPVLYDRIGLSLGPLTLGIKRITAPAMRLANLPKIDLILLSHAHFDHFDIPTLRALENRHTSVVTASKTSDLLRVRRYREVRELGWNERTQVGPAVIRGLEVNHWGARYRTDMYRGYNGYLLDVGRWRILFGGDTAMTSALRVVKGSKPVDLALMPIGAYNPWIRYHCTPEQAMQMGNQAGADRYVPVHHQTFQLSSEPFFEPIERFRGAAGSRPEDRVLVNRVGEDFRIS
jgi:L-ascorbate metabolism protein UlaG (beta-lactamase superfamily)